MEDIDFYPDKPELEEVKTTRNNGRTILSIVIFVLSLLLLFADSINFIIYLVIVLLIHEFGHFSLMKLFKYENVRLLFVPLMGAFVQGKKEEYRQRESILVVIAGPIPGIIIGSLLLYFGAQMNYFSMIEIGLLFLFLNMINLLPLDPLDGGHLLKVLINSSQERFQLVFSFLSSLLLIAIGLYLNEWIIVIFGFLMGFRVRSIQKNYQIHKELLEENVNYKVSYKNLTKRDYSKIKQVILSISAPLRMYVDQMPEEETDPLIANQVNSVLVAPLEKDASIAFKIFTIVVWILSFILPIILLLNLDLKDFLNAI